MRTITTFRRPTERAGSIKREVKIAIIGTSAGGMNALKQIFSGLSEDITFPIVVVIHRLKNVSSKMEEFLQSFTQLKVKEAEDKEKLQAGHIYFSPANYHLLIERDQSIALSISEPVNFSRPSIDVSMVSVGEVYGKDCTGVVLTGANRDGASGLSFLNSLGAGCVVQDPDEAQVRVMPDAALEKVPDAQKLKLNEIGPYLTRLSP